MIDNMKFTRPLNNVRIHQEKIEFFMSTPMCRENFHKNIGQELRELYNIIYVHTLFAIQNFLSNAFCRISFANFLKPKKLNKVRYLTTRIRIARSKSIKNNFTYVTGKKRVPFHSVRNNIYGYIYIYIYLQNVKLS